MSEIVRIIIQSESGYGCIDYAYKDVITVRPAGISYRYLPYIESEMNSPYKWSYTVDSAAFRARFRLLSVTAEMIVDCEEKVTVLDAGAANLTIFYSDKTKKTREYFFVDEQVGAFFRLLREMIPACEKMPVLLEVEEEEDDE